MKSIYKKVGLLIAGTMVAVGAMAQTAEVSPTPGTLKPDINPGGCAGIELSYQGGASINRNAEGFISLYYGDQLLRQVPAGNFKSLHCFEGYDKYTESGQIQVAFYSDQRTAATKKGGEYTVTIPGGFFLCGPNKEPNKPQVIKYTMPSDTDVTGYSFIPEAGSTVSDLSSLTIVCPGEVTSVKTEPYWEEWEIEGEDGGKETVREFVYPFELHAGYPTSTTLVVPKSVTYSGNDVTLHFDPEELGNYVYYLLAKKESITFMNGGKEVTNEALTEIFTLKLPTRDKEWDLPIYPAEGTYENLPAFETGNSMVPQANFYVNVPDGYTVLMQRAYLYRINADGTSEKMSTSFYGRKGESNDDGTFKAYFVAQPTGDVNLPAGEYDLVIGAKEFFKGGTYSPEITYHFTFTGAPIEFEVSPAEDSELYSITTVKVTYPGKEVSVSMNEYDPKDHTLSHPSCYATISNGKSEFLASVALDKDDPSTVVYTVMGLPISEAGTWHFKSPAEYLNIEGSNPGTEFDFTVINPMIDPAPGTELSALGTFTLTVEDMHFFEPGLEAYVYSLDEYGLRGDVVATLLCTRDDKAGEIKIAPEDGKDIKLWSGEFQLVTPTWFFNTSKGQAGYYEYNYTIVGKELSEKPEIDPAEGSIGSVPEEFTLTVAGAEIDTVDTSLMSIVYYADEQGNPEGMGVLYYTAEKGQKPGTVVLKLKSGESDFQKDDKFVLVVPANLFTTSIGSMPAASYVYEIGENVAVETIETDAEGYTVYTTTGLRVLQGAKSLKGLPKGLYIINGKKTIVK